MIARLSARSRNQILVAITRLADGGKIEVYQGRQPARADDEIGDQLLLARLMLPDPAFASPINGAAGARSIDQQPALASGRANWARIFDASAEPLMDIDVGESGAALNLSSAQLFERGPVLINALVLRMPAA
jgi:hypothetical protein